MVDKNQYLARFTCLYILTPLRHRTTTSGSRKFTLRALHNYHLLPMMSDKGRTQSVDRLANRPSYIVKSV